MSWKISAYPISAKIQYHSSLISDPHAWTGRQCLLSVLRGSRADLKGNPKAMKCPSTETECSMSVILVHTCTYPGAREGNKSCET